MDRLTQVDTLMSFVGTVHPKRVSEPTHISHTAPRTTHYTNTCMSLEKQALGALLLAGQRSHVIAGQPAMPPMGASLLPGPVAPKGKPRSIPCFFRCLYLFPLARLAPRRDCKAWPARRGQGADEARPARRRQGADDKARPTTRRLLAP